MDEDKDVQKDSSPSSEGKEGEVEAPNPKGDDKDNNFAQLRKKLTDAERSATEWKTKYETLEQAGRTFTESKDEEKNDKKSNPLELVFQRDVKDVSLEWNKKNNATAEEWDAIKSKISFNGDETRSEINDKINEIYEALPTVKKRREAELIKKGRESAMREFSDVELDIGGGGDVDLGEANEPRFNSKEKRWLDAFGVPKDSRKSIDKSTDSNQWTVGKSPTRKFFSPS